MSCATKYFAYPVLMPCASSSFLYAAYISRFHSSFLPLYGFLVVGVVVEGVVVDFSYTSGLNQESRSFFFCSMYSSLVIGCVSSLGSSSGLSVLFISPKVENGSTAL